MAKRFGEASFIALSSREEQLLEFAKNGLTDQAIANELGISLATIATYWGRIRIKFGPVSRTEIVAKYLQSKSENSIDALKNQIDVLQQQLFSQDSLYPLLFAGMNDHREAINILDDEMRILYANGTSLRWLGRSLEEVLGKQTVEFWAEDRKQNWFDSLKRFKENPYDDEQLLNQPVIVRLPDGTVKSYVTNMTPFNTTDGLRLFAVTRMES